MENESATLRLSPECISYSNHARRPDSNASPAPIKNKSLKPLFRPNLKRFASIEKPQEPINSIEKCIKVNSVIKQEPKTQKQIKVGYLRPYKLNYSHDFGNESDYYSTSHIKRGKKLNSYYKIRHNVIPQTYAIHKKMLENYSFYLKGTQVTIP